MTIWTASFRFILATNLFAMALWFFTIAQEMAIGNQWGVGLIFCALSTSFGSIGAALWPKQRW